MDGTGGDVEILKSAKKSDSDSESKILTVSECFIGKNAGTGGTTAESTSELPRIVVNSYLVLESVTGLLSSVASHPLPNPVSSQIFNPPNAIE